MDTSAETIARFRQRANNKVNPACAEKTYAAWRRRGDGSLLNLQPAIVRDPIATMIWGRGRPVYVPTVVGSRHEVDGLIWVMSPSFVVLPHIHQMRGGLGPGPTFQVWPAPEARPLKAELVFSAPWHPAVRNTLEAIERYFGEKPAGDDTIKALLLAGNEWSRLGHDGIALPPGSRRLVLPKMGMLRASLVETRRPMELV